MNLSGRVPVDARLHLTVVVDRELAGFMGMADAGLARDKQQRCHQDRFVMEQGVPLALVMTRDAQTTPAMLVRRERVWVDVPCDVFRLEMCHEPPSGASTADFRGKSYPYDRTRWMIRPS